MKQTVKNIILIKSLEINLMSLLYVISFSRTVKLSRFGPFSVHMEGGGLRSYEKDSSYMMTDTHSV